MEALIKKTISIEFEGKKYALSDDMTVEEFLIDLGLPKDRMITLKKTKDGFVQSIVPLIVTDPQTGRQGPPQR